MDYLDKGKQTRNSILLFVGYFLIAIAIVTATLILVYQAYGFNLSNKGSVIQNGLTFFSSHPNPAKIYVNNQLRPEQTDTRLIIPSGVYKVNLSRDGYRDWTRTIIVDGGAVEHFDYPFLIPKSLTSKPIITYSGSPGLLTFSPDRRWILVQKPSSVSNFDLIDLKNPKKPVTSTLTIPANIFSSASSSEQTKLVSWADDNIHLLIEHLFDGKTEYVLINRSNPDQSLNLTNTLDIAGQVELNNKKFNTYEVLNSTSQELRLYKLGSTTNQLIASHVIAYKSYGSSTFAYITDTKAPLNRINVNILSGGTTYTIKTLPISSNYLVDLATYSGVLYVATGSDTVGKVYVYSDPIGQITNGDVKLPVPIWVLNVPGVNYLSFSDNTQFILAENNTRFSVYDFLNSLGYNYTINSTLDPPQQHAEWMDGDRIMYTSGANIYISDYDNRNKQQLVKSDPNFIAGFSSNYNYIFNINQNLNAQYMLNQTPLLAPKDQ